MDGRLLVLVTAVVVLGSYVPCSAAAAAAAVTDPNRSHAETSTIYVYDDLLDFFAKNSTSVINKTTTKHHEAPPPNNFVEIFIKNFAGVDNSTNLIVENFTKFIIDNATKIIFDNSTSPRLTGLNICTYVKNFKTKKIVVKYEIRSHTTSYICFKNWKFLCSFVTETAVPIQTETSENNVKIIKTCCNGYEKSRNGTECRPVCEKPCVWGTCISPNVCGCDEYHDGPTCRTRIGCPLGKFGIDCKQTCQCRNNASCDYLTGNCSCQPGYRGKYCEDVCPSGYYGHKCQNVCKCQTGAKCDPVNGACYCSPGYTGVNCELQCPPGFHGYKCQSECKYQNGTKCDLANENCTCLTKYEEHDAELNECNCQNGTLCNSVNETCSCEPGHAGNNCKFTCPPGYYGKNCQNPCKCQNGAKCDPVNGDCYCSPGYTGEYCSSTCPSGFYGHQCEYECKCRNGAKCDPVNGSCMCPPGLTGKNCLVWSKWKIDGENNKTECDCNWHKFHYCEPLTGACKCIQPIDGVCTCEPGLTGDDCEKPCPHGTYGLNCSSTCRCQNESRCRASDGICLCESGFFGPTCSEACPKNYYGEMCLRKCMCDVTMEICNHIEGCVACNSSFSNDSECMDALRLEPINNEAVWIFDILVILSSLIILTICMAVMMCCFYCCNRRQIQKRNLGHVNNFELRKSADFESNPHAAEVIRTAGDRGINSGNYTVDPRKQMTCSYTNETFFRNYSCDHSVDDDTGENLYLEIDESTFKRADDLYDHLDFLRPTESWKPHYQSAMVLQDQGGNSSKREETK